MANSRLFFTVVAAAWMTGLGLAASQVGEPDICHTESCNEIAKSVIEAMDQSADPCSDFYEYSCGNWPAHNPIADDESESNVLELIGEGMNNKTQELLLAGSPPKFQSEGQAKALFRQCLDEDRVERSGFQPAQLLLDELLGPGGWPVLNPKWNVTTFDPLSTLTKMHLYGMAPLFTIAVTPNYAVPTENLIGLAEPSTFASIDVLLGAAGEEITESYRTFLRDQVELVKNDTGDMRTTADSAADLEELLAFERQLILARMTAVENRDLSPLLQKTTFGAIYQSIFNRSWMAKSLFNFTRDLFDVVYLAEAVTETTPVVVRSRQYFAKLDEILLNLQSSPDGNRLLANYFGRVIVSRAISSLPKRYRNADARHAQRITGQDEIQDKPAAERCAIKTVSTFPLAVGAMYVRQWVPADAKPKAAMVVADLRMGQRALLTEASWMDNMTYTRALEKLDAMTQFVGYPDILVDNITAIDEDYKSIPIMDTFLATSLEISKNNLAKNLRKLVKKNKRDDPIDEQRDITAANAYYAPNRNSVGYLASLLQFPYFDAEAPFYCNYAGMGWVLGHEMTHGFDDQGSRFDSQGNMVSWWTSETEAAFSSRKQKLVDQYDQYSLATGKVNGRLTLGENIGDNGGINVAYKAYSTFRKRLDKPEQLLPGLETLSQDQLFFVAAAQIWCSATRPKAEALRLLMDVHSPKRFRVNGAMSNLPAFSSAFQCPAGSPMNPIQKNSVW